MSVAKKRKRKFRAMTNQAYCCDCGQALDWSEQNG